MVIALRNFYSSPLGIHKGMNHQRAAPTTKLISKKRQWRDGKLRLKIHNKLVL